MSDKRTYMWPKLPRIGGVHNPRWKTVDRPNAMQERSGVYTEFWNRAERRRHGIK